MWVILREILVGPLVLLVLLGGLMRWRARVSGEAPMSRSGEPSAPPRRRRHAVRGLVPYAWLALPVAGVVTYLPIYENRRYMSEYVVMAVLVAFLIAVGRFRRTTDAGRTTARLGLAVTIAAAVTFAWSAVKPLEHLAGHGAPGTGDVRIAAALRAAGLRPGEGTVFIGDPVGVLSAYWARLDRARVLGNVDDAGGAFWQLPAPAESHRLALLRSHTGARIAVTDEPQARGRAGWIPIAGTGDAYRTLTGL